MSEDQTWGEWLFGKQKTPQEIARREIRQIAHVIRNLEGTIQLHKNNEFKYQKQVREAVEQDNRPLAEVLAKSLLIAKTSKMKALEMKNLLEINMQTLQNIQTTQALTQCLGKITRSLKRLNQNLNIASIQKMIREYEMNLMKVEYKQELIQEQLEEPVASENEEGGAKQLVDQYYDEHKLKTPSVVSTQPIGEKDPLTQRLDKLKSRQLK
jgi:hypothetical protein